MTAKRPRMSFRDAVDLVPDDLPDGAYWAMAHEIAGLEYGEGFADLAPPSLTKASRPIGCDKCKRRFMTRDALAQHALAKHPPAAPSPSEDSA